MYVQRIKLHALFMMHSSGHKKQVVTASLPTPRNGMHIFYGTKHLLSKILETCTNIFRLSYMHCISPHGDNSLLMAMMR